MNYDKVTSAGTVIKAPAFTYRVLDSVPVLFHLAEWLVVIVAFQYADVWFGYVAAKIIWILLAGAFGLYLGVLVSNVAWRMFEDPFKNPRMAHLTVCRSTFRLWRSSFLALTFPRQTNGCGSRMKQRSVTSSLKCTVT